MKLLLIENDTYLAQSINNHLADKGYDCVYAKDINAKIPNDMFFDVVLASYDVCWDYKGLLSYYPNSIIIMMIKYTNDDTVTQLINSGIADYVLKPFSMAELLRKIEHYREFSILVQEVGFYKNYFEFIESVLNIPLPLTHKPPFVIRSNIQRSADIYAMRYARAKKISFHFLSLSNITWKDILKLDETQTIYVTGLERLKKSDQIEFLANISRKQIILSFISQGELEFNHIVDISNNDDMIDLNGDILSIKDYEKAVITKYECVYSDIELSKKLGMSRKSLWEKRKKYGISKKKKN